MSELTREEVDEMRAIVADGCRAIRDAAYARGLDAGRAEQRDLVARMREAMRHAVGADYEEAWDEALGEFDDILAGLPPEAGIERAMGEYGAAYARGLRDGARMALDARADAERLAEAAGEALVPIAALVVAAGGGAALSPEVKAALTHAHDALLAALVAHDDAVKP